MMYRRVMRVMAAAVLIGLAASAPSTHAQTRKPMSLIDVAELPRVLDPQLSPDGRSVVYALSHADWKANNPVWQLWRQDVGGGAPIQLTFTEAGIIPTAARWSPDGKTILFYRDGQLSVMSADGGEPRALTTHAAALGPVPSPSWTPDGAAVYFIAPDAPTAEERERARVRDDVYAYDETDFKQRHLWKVVVATGVEQAVTSGDFSVMSYRLSRDGTQIAFERSPTSLPGDAARAEVWTMTASGERARAVTSNQIDESDPELSPDNSQILFLAPANARLEPNYNNNLFVVPASGGAPKLVLPDFPYEVDRATWLPGGKTILASVNMGVHSEVFIVDVAARSFTQVTDGRHAIPPAPAPAWSVDTFAERAVFLFDEPTRFGDVWTLPFAGGTPTRVTNIYGDLDKTFALPRQEPYSWKGADGATIEGVLFYPADYEAGKPYPLVVQMHGGPTESDKYGAGAGFFQSYVPVLTGKGYIVFRPNYRGGTGYGNAFLRDVVGHYFNNMHLDVMAGVDALVAQGIADPNQLVAMGWSAGGHLTNKLITFTDRFKAASSGAGVADWTSMYAQTDIRFNRTTWFGGTPWQKNAPIDNYWNNSPLKDVAKVKTPTLFFVGERDRRVPMPQAIEMYRALKSNGVSTFLYAAPREAHQWGELRHLLFKANAELEWFEKYARGRAYTWEKAP